MESLSAEFDTCELLHKFHIFIMLLCLNNVISSKIMWELGYLSECNEWATCCMIQGSMPSVDKRFFSSLNCPDWLWAHKSSYSMGIGGFFPPGVNQLGPETDYSHPLVLRSRMSGALTLLPLYAFVVDTWTTLKVKTTDYAQLAEVF